jgi:hypothetical protein
MIRKELSKPIRFFFPHTHSRKELHNVQKDPELIDVLPRYFRLNFLRQQKLVAKCPHA